jgi:pyruvate/2-oxoglutarate dehydrogenase complex dihydrolipoamide dehydrogenase (E3) component
MDTEVTPALVKELSPDVLIAAVGSEPFVPPIPGVENAIIAASMFDDDAIGNRVVVIGGGMVGCEKALHLAHMDRNVIVLEMLENVASDATYLHWLALTKALEKNVTLEVNTKCTKITDGGVYAVKEGDEVFYPVDTVLLATGVKPRTNLVESLRGCAPDFSVIGDCNQPGTILEAIHYGYYTALNL